MKIHPVRRLIAFLARAFYRWVPPKAAGRDSLYKPGVHWYTDLRRTYHPGTYKPPAE